MSLTKIIFFGTPEFSVPFLDFLLKQQNIQILGVVTQPDKPVGRKQILLSCAVKQYAKEHKLLVLQPKNLKDKNTQDHIRDLQADMFVVVAYGKIIPQAILDVVNGQVLNVHPSLLPKYRGPSPLQFALLNAEKETGVTIMLLDAGMDTGPILSQEKISLDTSETLISLVKKVHTIGPKLLYQTIQKFLAQTIKPQPQNESQASLTHLLSREDGHIDWNQSAEQIDRKIRALNPWPGCWTLLKGKRVKILASTLSETSKAEKALPGTIFIKNNHLFVATSNNFLEILTLQIEGKPPIFAQDFINGNQEKELRFVCTS